MIIDDFTNFTNTNTGYKIMSQSHVLRKLEIRKVGRLIIDGHVQCRSEQRAAIRNQNLTTGGAAM